MSLTELSSSSSTGSLGAFGSSPGRSQPGMSVSSTDRVCPGAMRLPPIEIGRSLAFVYGLCMFRFF